MDEGGLSGCRGCRGCFGLFLLQLSSRYFLSQRTPTSPTPDLGRPPAPHRRPAVPYPGLSGIPSPDPRQSPTSPTHTSSPPGPLAPGIAAVAAATACRQLPLPVTDWGASTFPPSYGVTKGRPPAGRWPGVREGTSGPSELPNEIPARRAVSDDARMLGWLRRTDTTP